jgi:hypothetical protein
MRFKDVAVPGIIAGLVGGTVMALWFLIVDTIGGRPFYTPAFLASILVGMEGVDRSVALIAAYTVLHYAAFAVVGTIVAWLMARLATFPTLFLGLVLGFALFDLVFYLGVAFTGVDVVEQLGWPRVLAGNLLAGVGLVAYLHVRLGTALAWLPALTQNRIVREGVLAGVVGAVSVAVWFLIFDVVQGRVLFTPGALGSELFLRVAEPGEVQVNLLTVGGYTVFHFAAFITVGLVAAAIAIQAERTPPILLAGLLIFATFEAFSLGLLAIAAEWLVGELGWLSIGGANLIATLAMGYFLWQTHPKLRAVLRHETPLAAEDFKLP